MSNLSNFKIAVLAIFSLCIVGGVIMFALSKGSSTQSWNITIWGTIDPQVFDTAYRASSLPGNKTLQINYIKKDPATFDSDFVEALAQGVGPDAVILRDDSVYKNENKLFVIPYANYSERTFKDTFIEGGELYLNKDGVVALPFMVDPLVMYWNRDIFSNTLVPVPPKYWDEFYPLIDKMNKKDSSGNILQSSLALGGWENINNAKEILSAVLFQAGTPITAQGSLGKVESVLNSQFNYPVAPSVSAVNFYTQFSNPSVATYSWNRSLPNSLNFFLAGKLAVYFGFASEIKGIQEKNSNLNFDVTYLPQIRDASKKITFGHMYVLSIVKQSKQIGGAFLALAGLTESKAIASLLGVSNLPPVRLDLLGSLPPDPYKAIFYNSALLTHFWIDPNKEQSENIFRDMIESIISGRKRVSDALGTANDLLSAQLQIK